MAWLLGEAGRTKNVTGVSFHAATKLTPMERVKAASSISGDTAMSQYADIDARYASFLENTNKPKADLLTQFSSRGLRRTMMDDAETFGDRLFELLKTLGGDQRLYRYVVI